MSESARASLRRIAAAGAVVLCAGGEIAAADDPRAVPPVPPPVTVEFFFRPGCDECAQVREQIFPALESRYAGLYTLRERDLDRIENYQALVAAMARFGVERNESVWLLVGRRRLLGGWREILEQADDAIEEALAEPPIAERTATGMEPEPPAADADWLAGRMRSLAAANVMVAGLIDGLNPCAISTLVFLVSVLSLSRVRGRHLIAVGAVFCLATFLTYGVIGFGLLQALYRLAAFRTLQKALDRILTAALGVMAILSFRDAWRFHRTQNSAAVSLKLPPAVSRRVHRLLRAGFSRQAQMATVFVVGCLVTALESVCTGQIYVPTLVWVVRTGADRARGLAYLALYNAMFLVPLITVLGLAYAGLEWLRLADWSRRNVPASKTLMGIFFLGLAAAVLALS